MRVGIHHSQKELDSRLAECFADGVRAHGDTVIVGYEDAGEPVDAAYVFGVKAREQFGVFRSAGAVTVMLDKGYVRRTASHEGLGKACEFWRVAVGAHHPTGYLSVLRSPSDRWERLGIDVAPWRSEGDQIILAGSSGKYHEFNGLEDPTEYARKLVRRIQKLTGRPLIYRPKPSWRDAVPIAGALYSRHPDKLIDLLDGAHALVTNGSNSCFEAVVAGVPCVVLGDAVARPISSTSIHDVLAPRLAGEEERMQWFFDLAYCQWTMDEFASGEAWGHIRSLVHAQQSL